MASGQPSKPEETAYHELYAQQSSNSSLWIVLGVVGGAVVLSAAVLAIGVFGFRVDYRVLPPLESDLAMLVRASDFESQLGQVVIRTDAESIEKRRYENGDTILIYAYEHPEPNSDLYISCRICVFDPEEDNRAKINAEKKRNNSLAKSLGGNWSAQKWIPPSYSKTVQAAPTELGTIRQGETILGHTLFLFTQDRVFSLVVYGAGFEFEDDFANRILPTVESLSTYGP